MKNINLWIPKKVSEELIKEKHSNLTINILEDKFLPNIKRNIALTTEQVDRLYEGKLQEIYVNGIFICYY